MVEQNYAVCLGIIEIMTILIFFIKDFYGPLANQHVKNILKNNSNKSSLINGKIKLLKINK